MKTKTPPGPRYQAAIQPIGESALVVVSDGGHTWGLPLEMFKRADAVNKQRDDLLAATKAALEWIEDETPSFQHGTREWVAKASRVDGLRAVIAKAEAKP